MTVEAIAIGVSLIPSAAQDVVAVYDQDFNQVFRQARPLKATIKEESKLMDHPLETGAEATDHTIILQVQIELSMKLRGFDYQDTYQKIRQLYLERAVLNVQTRATVYENQIIESMPHEESPDEFDSIIIALKLREIQIVTSQTEIAPQNPSNGSTVKRGTIQAQDPAPITEEKKQSTIGSWNLLGPAK